MVHLLRKVDETNGRADGDGAISLLLEVSRAIYHAPMLSLSYLIVMEVNIDALLELTKLGKAEDVATSI